jgi:tetratricopeptide (TPR) repeat protein
MQISKTIQANAETLDELSAQIIDRPGSVVPIIGAGTSIPYGMPGWFKFLEYLLTFAERTHEMTSHDMGIVRDLLKKKDLEEAAELLYVTLGEPNFRTALQSRFRLLNQPVSGPLMRHIIDLAGGLIITTNYDRVIEAAWQHSFKTRGIRRDVTQLLATSKDDLKRAFMGSGHAVLKLHGDVERPETWVLTAERYKAMYTSPAFKTFLSQLFSVHIPLFIGCSMTEDRLLDAIRRNNCIGYAILASPSSDEEKREISSRLKDCIRIIWLCVEDLIVSADIYDLIEPLLHWLVVRRRVGRVAFDANTRAFGEWLHIMDKFESEGRFNDALAWIETQWQERSSWKLAVEYLRFADLAGNPSKWQTFVSELRGTLRDEPPILAQHAMDYFYGRLLGQSGYCSAALGRHAVNRPYAPHSDQYQIRSLFEEGQIRFQTEDFDKAQSVFEEVYYLLVGRNTHEMILTDVLKFLATIHVLDTIYDAPGSDGLWIKGRHSNADLCLAYSDAALKAATDAKYSDGKAWALCVSAFAHETKGNITDATECYSGALQNAQKPCRVSTEFYIRIYESAFLRRIKRYESANESLLKASVVFETRVIDQLRLAEQRLLLAWALGDNTEARKHLAHITDLWAITPMLLDGSTGLERRMRRLQTDRRYTS